VQRGVRPSAICGLPPEAADDVARLWGRNTDSASVCSGETWCAKLHRHSSAFVACCSDLAVRCGIGCPAA
jgi:hypothetical protein